MNLDEMQLDSEAFWDFWDQCESEANLLEITVDYYLMEFCNVFNMSEAE
jgi:hypothetical protein